MVMEVPRCPHSLKNISNGSAKAERGGVCILPCWIIGNSNESVSYGSRGNPSFEILEKKCRWLCKGREGWRLHCHIKEDLPMIMRVGVSTHAIAAGALQKMRQTISNICCSKRIVPVAYHVLCGALWHTNIKQDKVYTSRPEDRE